VHTLVSEKVFGVGPTSVLLTDTIADGNFDIIEKNLVDLVLTIYERNGSKFYSRRFHIDQQERNTLLLPCIRIGANQAENPISEMTERIPGFLSIDNVMIAVPLRARRQ